MFNFASLWFQYLADNKSTMNKSTIYGTQDISIM